ncbi:MAG TPA: GNAT family N-acetyltransferase [Streptosporangiaceae bacterium]|nr:GNAT family N-acetyltransferase [Streptosporangiaceae bacterium]
MTAESVRTSSIRAYEARDSTAWDQLIGRSVNGTFLHTRKFLAYHGDRFADRSLVVTDDHDKIVGAFPAAELPSDSRTVSSHPGLTYGGLVHDGSLYGAVMLRALEDIAACYRSMGYSRLQYKAVPYIYWTTPAADDLYALFRLGSTRYGCDMAAVIDLSRRGKVRSLRQRGRKRAMAAGVHTGEDWADVAEYWRILAKNLSSRHDSRPTHSLAEIEYLHERFPNDILLVVAKIGAEIVGGCVFFATALAVHMQYAATNELGRTTAAADLVLERGIAIASERGCRYFTFGTSTNGLGESLNESQYWFKVSFGAGGVTHDHYELAL